MLYISRRVGQNKYGIMDTDDGVEEVVTLRDLGDILDSGLEIKGLEVIENYRRRGRDYRRVKIEVYQDAANLSRLQAKTKVLRGVDIKTVGGTVTQVTWQDENLPADTVIRLSDYGSMCADCVFTNMPRRYSSSIKLILDDKIKLRSKALYGANSVGAVLDLREVTNKRTARWAYEEWMNFRGSLTLDQFIIDNPDRFEQFQAIGTIRRGKLQTGVRMSERACRIVVDEFRDEWQKLAASEFRFASTVQARDYFDRYGRAIMRDVDFWASGDVPTYEAVKAHDRGVLNAIAETTTCNRAAAVHLYSYLTYFTPTEEIRKLFVDLAVRANNWFIELYESGDWYAW